MKYLKLTSYNVDLFPVWPTQRYMLAFEVLCPESNLN